MLNPSPGSKHASSAIQSEVKEKITGFGKVFESVIKSDKLSPSAKAVYAYLSAYADKDYTCFPGQDRIARELGFSGNNGRRQILRITEMLIDFGALSVKKREGHNFYTLIERSSNYGYVYKGWLCNPEIKRSTKAVYALMSIYLGSNAEELGGDGLAFPTIKEIAENMGRSTNTAEGYVKLLVNNGMVSKDKIQGKRGLQNTYRIQLPPKKVPYTTVVRPLNDRSTTVERNNTPEKSPILSPEKVPSLPPKNVPLRVTGNSNKKSNTLLSNSIESDVVSLGEIKETANINNGSPNNESNLSANDWAVYLKVKEYCKQNYGVENFSISQFKIEVSNMGTVHPFEYDKIQEIGFWLLPAEIRMAV